MDFAETAQKYGQNEEDRLLLRRVLDKLEANFRKNIPTATQFLNAHEQALCRAMLAGAFPERRFKLDGGYLGAERAVLAFPADWQEIEDMERPVCALRAVFSPMERLNHRDFLGALMGAGIKRETVGDILIVPGRCDMVLLPEILPYVQLNLERAGRVKLLLETLDLEQLSPPEPEVKLVRDTVASPRLDSILAAGFSLSREKAADLVRAGHVQVEFFPCDKPDKELRAGERISARGLGRLELESLGGKTRKGRTSVVIKRYI